MSELPQSPGFTSRPILRCRNLERYLGEGENRVQILRKVDLDLDRGKIYAITGPSGCGKSTLLYTLGLLDREDSGEIWIKDLKVSGADDHERTEIRNRTIGFVFQFHFLLPEFTALENIMLPMIKLGQMSSDAMQSRAHNLLEEVGLGEKSKRLANQLSGGEQQRVAIARALANQPDIILADEPTGNLDQKNSTIVIDLLCRMAREKDQTILVVTHNHAIAEACDQTLPMLDGVFASACEPA
ncbi:MAG: ABC transporter ATP-binding protein [Opitutae bacterium]|nr:ABC transporter ATP-binding protein [Opitutae bacterium]